MARKRKGAASAALKRYGEAPQARQRFRMRFIMVVLLGALLVIAGRLGQLHLNPRIELTEEEKKHIGVKPVTQSRGEIVDRNALLLASNRQVPSIWADPRKVKDPGRVADLLWERLGIERKEVLEQLSKRDDKGNSRKFVWLARWLQDTSEADLDALIVEAGPGVMLRHEDLRYYPQGDTAAHLLGFVNRAGDASEGLELLFNESLEAVPGMRLARKDGNRTLLDSLTMKYEKPRGSEKVHLTLDVDIQHTLERELDVRMEECNAPRGMGMVMDPHSGAILALTSRPAFDPNRYDEFPAELRKNSALLDVFEPGSAFKIVTASAALEHGLVNTETLIDCEGGRFNPYGHTIRDFHKFDIIPFSKCFEESSNIAMVKVAALLGAERLEQWIRRFGFGEQTARDFQFESRGIFRPRSKWSRLSMGSLPMGQEIAVTIPQLARSFALIANGGFLVEPYLVERVVDRDGQTTYAHRAPRAARMLSPETAATMRELCHQVVLRGTGEAASIPEYRVGGKTGTAQMKRKDGPGYDPDRYTTVFAGFAPVGNPRLVAVIVIPEPMIRLHYGGYVCGPVFKNVVRDALIRLNVPKDPVINEDGTVAEPEPAPLPMARVEPVAVRDADTVVERPDVFSIEESLEELLEPLDGLELVARRVDRTDGGTGLPDFRGLTKRQAREQLLGIGVPWDAQGAGWVVAQTPPPGTPLGEVALCALEFSPRKAVPTDDPQRT